MADKVRWTETKAYNPGRTSVMKLLWELTTTIADAGDDLGRCHCKHNFRSLDNLIERLSFISIRRRSRKILAGWETHFFHYRWLSVALENKLFGTGCWRKFEEEIRSTSLASFWISVKVESTTVRLRHENAASISIDVLMWNRLSTMSMIKTKYRNCMMLVLHCVWHYLDRATSWQTDQKTTSSPLT